MYKIKYINMFPLAIVGAKAATDSLLFWTVCVVAGTTTGMVLSYLAVEDYVVQMQIETGLTREELKKN